MRILLFILLAASATAGTFHVSPDGDDGASGTAAAPWRTIQRALAGVDPDGGVTIEVEAGVYEGPVKIDTPGKWRRPLILRGKPGAEISAPDADSIEITASGPVVVEGFTLRPAGGAGVRVSSRSPGIILRALEIESDGSGDGIIIESAPDCLIERNRIRGARHGIVAGGGGALIRNNEVLACRRSGLVLGLDRVAIDATVRNNSLLENGSSAAQPGALWIADAQGGRIESNILAAPAGRRLVTVDTPGPAFSHNLYFTPNDRSQAAFSWSGRLGHGFASLQLQTADPAAMFADPLTTGTGLDRLSPAIDAGAGNPGPLERDRSGNPRHVGLAIDRGAHEFPRPTGLRVADNQLIHQNRIIRLRGVGVGDPVLDRQTRPFSDYDVLRERWNANTVRMSVHPLIWRNPDAYGGRQAILDWFRHDIDAAVRAGLYVILDWHVTGWPNGFARPSDPGEPAGLHDSDFELAKDFWEAAAREFGDNGMVAFELWNEPVRGPDDWKPNPSAWKDLRPYFEEFTAIVRKHSDNLVIVTGSNWAYGLGGIRADPPSDPNTAIAWHVYAGKEENDEKRWVKALANLHEKLPVIVTEWGFDENGPPHYRGGVTDFGAKFAKNWLDGRGLHWVAWCWHPDVGPALIESDWKTPTPFGGFVGSLLRANPRAKPAVPENPTGSSAPRPAYSPFSIN